MVLPKAWKKQRPWQHLAVTGILVSFLSSFFYVNSTMSGWLI
jgi:hypothetical protein